MCHLCDTIVLPHRLLQRNRSQSIQPRRWSRHRCAICGARMCCDKTCRDIATLTQPLANSWLRALCCCWCDSGVLPTTTCLQCSCSTLMLSCNSLRNNCCDTILLHTQFNDYGPIVQLIVASSTQRNSVVTLIVVAIAKQFNRSDGPDIIARPRCHKTCCNTVVLNATTDIQLLAHIVQIIGAIQVCCPDICCVVVVQRCSHTI